jgi:hypothetical protein
VSLSKFTLSLLSSGSGNKNKKHGRVRCVYRVVVFPPRSFMLGSRKIVRSTPRERRRFKENQKRETRVDCFFLPFFPREWPKKPLQKGWGSGTNELFLKERREGKRHAAVEFCLVFQFFLLPSRAHGARAFGDEALTFFFFFFMFCRDTQAEPAVRSRGAGGRRGEKTRRAELFATLERSPER